MMRRLPPTLILLGLLSLSLTGQTRSEVLPFPIPDGYEAERDVVYSRTDRVDLKLDIYFTKEPGDPLPLIIWIHGGAWRSGDKKSARFARELLGKGYAVASINYRLSHQAIFPAQIIDCKSAVRWLRANAGYYNIDPGRFAAWGASAGAHLAALLGTAGNMPEWEQGAFREYSSSVQAVIDWFGPTDFSRMDDIPGRMVHLEAGSPESILIGGAVRDHPEKVAYANPITYVDESDPPFQILHGKDDLLVLPNQAELLYAALNEAGVHVDFALLDSTSHGGREWNLSIPRARRFLDEHLQNNPSRARPETPEPRKKWTHRYFRIDPILTPVRFRSGSAGSDYGCMVYLPPSYIHATARRYPVIYWLPGRSGNPVGVRRFAEQYHSATLRRMAPEAIIVGVNGIHSSMYTNDKAGKFPVESVITHELIPYIDSSYRTIPLREMRAIDGFSMGGYGAARLGLKHNDLFGVISIVGAAMHRPETLRDERPEIFAEVFGEDLDYCRRHSPWTLLLDYSQSRPHGLFIRQIVGSEDMLAEKNRDFHERMTKLGIDHEYQEIEGAGHNYPELYSAGKGNPFDFYQKAFSVDLPEPFEAVRARSRPDPDFRDIPYGPHERHRLDLWMSDSDHPAPLVIFIHGGGFRHGDKRVVYNHELNEFLHTGFSVASINYRLLPDNPLPATFLDGRRALRFIRSRAADWNIDPSKIGVFGGSAGAQIAMWMGFSDLPGEAGTSGPSAVRLLFTGSKGGQITMNMNWWEEHIPGYESGKRNEPAFGSAQNTAEEVANLTGQYAAMTHVSGGDPPVYIYHKMAPEDPPPLLRREVSSWQVHHIAFGEELHRLCEEAGVSSVLNYPGAASAHSSIVSFAKEIVASVEPQTEEK